MLIHSYFRKSLKNVKWMLVLLLIRLQLGFTQLAEKDIGDNANSRGLNRAVASALLIMQTLQLCNQVFGSNRLFFLYILANVIAMFVMITMFNKSETADATDDDYIVFIAVPFVSVINMTIFIFINSENVLANVTRSIHEFEFSHYKEMFNSL